MCDITQRLFVYGTLRQGSTHPMAKFLARCADYLGRARAPGRLYDLGAYPGAKKAISSDDWITGDMYALHDAEKALGELDRYEGCDANALRNRLFERALVEVEAESEVRSKAWIYYYVPPVAPNRRIASGEYRATLG